MSRRAYYSSAVPLFLTEDPSSIFGKMTEQHRHSLDQEQKSAWLKQIDILKDQLKNFSAGHIFFEFSIPRMGKRADVVLVYRDIIYVLEFKIGSEDFYRYAIDQVEDYALDLKNFHEGSHKLRIIPVLVATKAQELPELNIFCWSTDEVAKPVCCGQNDLAYVIEALARGSTPPFVDPLIWEESGYKPTPTIIEAAKALYESHKVQDISRSDAGAKNLIDTCECIDKIIEASKRNHRKSICFVTGVPGAGKTLAGLNIATQRAKAHSEEHAVFLSGNGPLVYVLREALARDKVERDKISKTDAHRKVHSFIQNIHHFRDENLKTTSPPPEKVAIFDEAQRAWTKQQVAKFMQQKRGLDNFDMSEPEFLISIMDRHQDWCAIVCLIGGGQEINTGEAGLVEWLAALSHRFRDWDIFISPQFSHKDYSLSQDIKTLTAHLRIQEEKSLHLATSMRSFRAEEVSDFVADIVDNLPAEAKLHHSRITRYPMQITRDIDAAREWLRSKARGTERYGIIASSGSHRLRPDGIFIRAKIEATDWFLNDKSDVRASYYLEDVATEFDIQGLELDYTCVCWDADFRYQNGQWESWHFKGTKWQSVNDPYRKLYLKNAYRVLLTRARQGMVVFVPHGDDRDPTRPAKFYDQTYAFLKQCGLQEIP